MSLRCRAYMDAMAYSDTMIFCLSRTGWGVYMNSSVSKAVSYISRLKATVTAVVRICMCQCFCCFNFSVCLPQQRPWNLSPPHSQWLRLFKRRFNGKVQDYRGRQLRAPQKLYWQVKVSEMWATHLIPFIMQLL